MNATFLEVTRAHAGDNQVEYFDKHISEREKVIISLHTHNDRGKYDGRRIRGTAHPLLITQAVLSRPRNWVFSPVLTE